MPLETDTQQIPGFALLQLRAREDDDQRRQARITARDAAFDLEWSTTR